jgi:hypothetical protein
MQTEQPWTRCATQEDASWIVELSGRVQDALTTSGSLQLIGPLLLENTEPSILGGNVFVLENEEKRLGTVLVDPLPSSQLVQWALPSQASPWWYLHSFMLEPEEQGKRLG